MGVAAFLLILSGILYLLGFDIKFFKESAYKILPWLEQTNPFVFFAAMALLPLISLPITPLLIATGIIYGISTTIIGVSLALALNISLGYFVAHRLVRSWAEKMVRKAGFSIPTQIPTKHIHRIILLVRLTPGMPLFAQNYILGLLRIPFSPYFMISWPLQTISSLGWALTGGALYQGKPGLAIMGCSLLLIGVLLVKLAKPFLSKSYNFS